MAKYSNVPLVTEKFTHHAGRGMDKIPGRMLHQIRLKMNICIHNDSLEVLFLGDRHQKQNSTKITLPSAAVCRVMPRANPRHAFQTTKSRRSRFMLSSDRAESPPQHPFYISTPSFDAFFSIAIATQPTQAGPSPSKARFPTILVKVIHRPIV